MGKRTQGCNHRWCADQILTIGAGATAHVSVGLAVTQATSSVVAGVGTTSINDGYLQGIITGIGVSTIDVKVLNRVSAAGTVFPVTYTEGGAYAFTVGTATSTGQFGVPGTAGVSISTDFFDSCITCYWSFYGCIRNYKR